MNPDLVWLASFDIGRVNFAFYIEEVNVKELMAIKNVPKTHRYNPDGTPTGKMQSLLDQVCMNGRTVLHKNLDLTENCDPKAKLDPETYHNMIDALNEYKEYWDKCSAFVIEEQMSFGAKINKMAVKLGQHCYSYFTFLYGRQKHYIEFRAFYKTQILGAEKGISDKPYKSGKPRYVAMKKPQRKKWSVQKATEILEGRDELAVLENLSSKAKKDDLADTLCQLQAFKYLVYVDKSFT